MKIEVIKYTDVDSLRMANGFTSGHQSVMSLARAYALGHTPIRTQRFYIKMYDIPLFCASQFVRSTQGVQWYQRSKRTDRGGEDFRAVCEAIAASIDTARKYPSSDILTSTMLKVEDLPKRFDRYAPTDLLADINAEAIINMSHKRLCKTASRETREIWEQVVAELAKVDADLARMCVRPCVASGGICREQRKCGFSRSELCHKMVSEYKKMFV